MEKKGNTRRSNRNDSSFLKKGVFGLKCMYSNVDQMLNKMDDLLMLVASDEPDIMLFTEMIPKARVNCNLGASGIRGVGIYIKNNIKCIEANLMIKSG